MLSHALSHVGNVFDNVDALNFDRNEIGRPQASIQYVGVYLVLVILDQLDQLLYFLVVQLVRGHGGRGSGGGGGGRRKHPYACRYAFVVAFYLLLVARFVYTF